VGYKEELDALGRWIFKTAGLKSHRLSEAPPQVSRPVVLWQGPNRRNGRSLGNYSYLRRISQYGTLYVSSLDQLAEVLDKLEKDLAARNDLLPMYETDQAGSKQIGWLTQVQLDLNTAETVDIPIVVRYEVVQDRIRPEEAPAAINVTNTKK